MGECGSNWTHIFGITLLGGALYNGPIEFPQYFVKLFVKLIYQLNSVIRIEGLCFGSVRKKKKKIKGLFSCSLNPGDIFTLFLSF